MLKKALVTLAVVAVILAGIGLMLPRHVHVERSARIAAPRATVFALLNSYQRFNEWSPWSGIDPGAKYTHSGPMAGVGARLSWLGDPGKLGAGSQEIVESRPGESVKAALDFGSDGKATALFTLARDGAGTRVTWAFDTDLEWNPVARYVGLMFDRMVGRDYDKGLTALKRLAESLPGADFEGLVVQHVEVASLTVAYVEAACSRDEQAIAAAVGRGLAEVRAFLKAQRLQPAGAPLTIDTRWDDTGYGFDAALPVEGMPAGNASGSKVRLKRTYAGRALKVAHKGPRRELAATYDQLLAYAAAHAYAPNGPWWDEYVSDASAPEAERMTHVYLPVK
jgi:effector-binding domain-containing protein/carbon monoxide dehydrogenase subunit G